MQRNLIFFISYTVLLFYLLYYHIYLCTQIVTIVSLLCGVRATTKPLNNATSQNVSPSSSGAWPLCMYVCMYACCMCVFFEKEEIRFHENKSHSL